MKKIVTLGVLLLAVIISVSAVSAFEWSFSSSDNSNSNGGSVSLDNNVLKIQGFEYTIPEGYKENESAKIVGEDADQNIFPGFKISSETFEKGDDAIIIKVVFGDEDMDEDEYTPGENATATEIADTEGYITKYTDGVSFDYVEDGKIVEIFAPDEQTLSSLLSSSDD